MSAVSSYAGSLIPVEAPLVPLVLVPLAPLLGSLVIVFLGKRLGERRSALVSLVATALAFALSLASAARLASLEEARRSLFDVAFALLRIGSLDASLSFVLDPVAAAFLVSGLGVIGFVLLRAWRASAKNPPSLRSSGSAALLASSISLVSLAADAVVLFFGFAGLAVSTYLFASRARASAAPPLSGKRAFLASSFGDALCLLGFSLLFWGLGGTWPEGRFLSDYRPRFVAVHAEGHLPAEEVDADDDDEPRGERDARVVAAQLGKRGALTFTSHPGARVFLGVDDLGQLAKNPELFGVAPFVRKEIGAGVHSLVVVPGGGATVSGDGTEVGWIERLVVAEDEEVRLVPLGPTLAFREVLDQMSIRDAGGPAVLEARARGEGRRGLALARDARLLAPLLRRGREELDVALRLARRVRRRGAERRSRARAGRCALRGRLPFGSSGRTLRDEPRGPRRRGARGRDLGPLRGGARGACAGTRLRARAPLARARRPRVRRGGRRRASRRGADRRDERARDDGPLPRAAQGREGRAFERSKALPRR